MIIHPQAQAKIQVPVFVLNPGELGGNERIQLQRKVVPPFFDTCCDYQVVEQNGLLRSGEFTRLTDGITGMRMVIVDLLAGIQV